MNATQFCDMLERHGLDFATGVPCSILKDIIHCLSSRRRMPYVGATREDEAIGIAAGAFLGGRSPVVLMQNSGLGSAINPLASLAIPYRIPLLMIVSWRGYEGNDAPEHLVMGRVTTRLLEDLGVDTYVMEADDPERSLSAALRSTEASSIPAAVLLRRGLVQ